MKKLLKRIVCSFLISSLVLSGLPAMGVMDTVAEEVELKRTQIESILKRSLKSYDLIFYFQDVRDVSDANLENTVIRSQKKARILLDDAVSRGLASEYKVFEPINAISVVIHDEQLIKELTVLEEVVEVQENQVVDVDFPEEQVQLMSRSYIPDSPDGVEWGVKAVHADKVWEEYGLTGAGVTVGIIDTGVNYRLSSLKNSFKGYDPGTGSFNAAYYRDFTTGSTEPGNSGNDHGTHVAGIIVGKEGDGVNQTGVAPGAKFISAKAVSADKQYTNTTVVEAFLWLIEQDVDIINCSFGAMYSSSNTYLEKVIALAESKNIAVVISSGNVKPNQQKGLLYPAATRSGGIVVGSVNQDLQLSSFSARGPSPMDGMKGVIRPDLVAPGEWVRSTMYSGRLGVLSGTSQAAPHVSGVIALMKEAKPDITVEEIKNVLKASAHSLTDSQFTSSPNMGYGYGLINAYDAVSYVKGRRMGNIYGNIRSGAPRIMTVYDELVLAPAFTISKLPFSEDRESEVEDVFEFPPIKADLIKENTKFSLDFVDRSDVGYAYIAVSRTGKEEYFPDEWEVFDLGQDLDRDTVVHREYSLSEYSDSEYVYVRLYVQDFGETDVEKLLLKGYSVFDETDDAILGDTSESDSENKNNNDLPISEAANPSNDSSAGPGKVIGTTAPSIEGETASLEAPQPGVETSDAPQTELAGVRPESTSDAQMPIAQIERAEVATASDAMAKSSADAVSESTFTAESNQPQTTEEVIKSQPYGEESRYFDTEQTGTTKQESARDGADSQPVVTTRQEEITHDDIVESNGLYNIGVTPQSIKYAPISMRNLNLNIPFKPMVKVLSSGKSVFVNDKGYYTLSHSVNPEGKPLLLEVSAYGYETKVIEVDLNKEKDQRRDIVLDPAPLAKVQGRLTDENGNPIDGAIVHILEDRLIENVRTSGDGSYRINAAYKGIYTIMFSKEGYLTKTMRVGLRAGENQLKDVRLYKISDPVDESITNGFDPSQNRLFDIELQSRGDSIMGGAVRFTPPNNNSILKSASLYMMSGNDYRGNEISIGVLGEKNGKLTERIPFRDYKVNANGWATFDLSSYYLHSTEPVYIVYLYNKSAAQSAGVGIQKNASPKAINDSFLFDGDLHPFANVLNYRGYGIAMTTNWLSGVFPQDAGNMQEQDDFDPAEFGPTYEYEIGKKIIDITGDSNGGSGGSGGTPKGSVEREFDDGGLSEALSREGKDKNPSAPSRNPGNTPDGSLGENDLSEIDSKSFREEGRGDDLERAEAREYTKEEQDVLLANGKKIIQNHVVPADTVEGSWSLNPNTKKWSLYVDGQRVKNRWMRVFTQNPTEQGTHHSWFHFDEDGQMSTGFYRDLGYFYYLNESNDHFEGELALGWKKINEDYFYFRNDGSEIEGAMLTGWLKIADKRYYLFPDGENLGKMAIGWVNIQGKDYYFSEDAGTLGELMSLRKDAASEHRDRNEATQAPAPKEQQPTFSKIVSSAKESSEVRFETPTVPSETTASKRTTNAADATRVVPPFVSDVEPTTYIPTLVADVGEGGSNQNGTAGEREVKIGAAPTLSTRVISDVEVAKLISPGQEENNAVWEPTLKENVLFVEEVFPYIQDTTAQNADASHEKHPGIPEHGSSDGNLVNHSTGVSLSEGRRSDGNAGSDRKQNAMDVPLHAEGEGTGAYGLPSASEGRRAMPTASMVQDRHNPIENAIEESNVVSNVKKGNALPDLYPLIEEQQ